MAKKKKTDKPTARDFGNNPFSDLKGFAVSVPEKNKSQDPAPPPATGTGEVIGSFAEEMEMLGVRPLTSSQEEGEVEQLEKPARPAQKKNEVHALSDEEMFRRSVGELQVRFSDHLPEEDEPARATPRRMRQLKLGKLIPEASLDLHGLQRAEVAGKIRFFLQDAIFQGWRVVLIITGKGLHSEAGEAVLRSEAERFLNEEGRVWAAEWGRAPRQYGGAGALVLFLRKS